MQDMWKRCALVVSVILITMGVVGGECGKNGCGGPVREEFRGTDCRGASKFESVAKDGECQEVSMYRHEKIRCREEEGKEYVERVQYDSEEGCEERNWISLHGWRTGVCIPRSRGGVDSYSEVYWCEEKEAKREKIERREGPHIPAPHLLRANACPADTGESCIEDYMTITYVDLACTETVANYQPTFEWAIKENFCYNAPSSPLSYVSSRFNPKGWVDILTSHLQCGNDTIYEIHRTRTDFCLQHLSTSSIVRRLTPDLLHPDRSMKWGDDSIYPPKTLSTSTSEQQSSKDFVFALIASFSLVLFIAFSLRLFFLRFLNLYHHSPPASPAILPTKPKRRRQSKQVSSSIPSLSKTD